MGPGGPGGGPGWRPGPEWGPGPGPWGPGPGGFVNGLCSSISAWYYYKFIVI